MSQTMGTLVLRNVPDGIHARLKAQARRNRRSLNNEGVSLIEQALAGPEAVSELPRPIELRGGPLTIGDMEGPISAGRD